MALVEPQHALLTGTPRCSGSPHLPEVSLAPTLDSQQTEAPEPEPSAEPAEHRPREWGPWTKLIAKTCASLSLLVGLSAVGTYITWRQPQARGVELSAQTDSSAVWLAPSGPEPARASKGSPAPAHARAAAAPVEVANSRRGTVSSAQPRDLNAPEVTPVPAPESDRAALPSAGLTADGKVILNQAGLSDLRRLPGVGAKRAESILALRSKLGRFKSPHDLLRIRGIGPRMLRRWLPLLVLDAPVTRPADPS